MIQTIPVHPISSAGLQRLALRASAFGCSLVLLACSSLPNDGPRTAQIQDEYQAQSSPHPFVLVDVTPETVSILKQRVEPSFAASFGSGESMPDTLIGRGDSVTVTIWEVGSDPLFSPSPPLAQLTPVVNSARGAVIPEQIVGSDGSISIPFAGRLSVAGHTTLEAQKTIEQALSGKAQKPQVLVSVSHNTSNAVTVIGEVTAGSRVPLTAYGERLLDVLATAGGIKAPTYETRVQLTRGADSIALPLLQVLGDPRENVRLQGGDSLVITRQPETFTAFGATGHNAQFDFGAARLSLAEAMAKAGGLTDSRADPRGVFLFRFEPKDTASQLGPAPGGQPEGTQVPVVYRLDFTKVESYFLAENFNIRDHDMLYVSNSPSTELEKFLNLVGQVAQPLINGAIVNSTVK